MIISSGFKITRLKRYTELSLNNKMNMIGISLKRVEIASKTDSQRLVS